MSAWRWSRDRAGTWSCALEEGLEGGGKGGAGEVACGAVEVEQADASGEVQIHTGEVGFEGPQDGDRVAVVADVDPAPEVGRAQPGSSARRGCKRGKTAPGRASGDPRVTRRSTFSSGWACSAS